MISQYNKSVIESGNVSAVVNTPNNKEIAMP